MEMGLKLANGLPCENQSALWQEGDYCRGKALLSRVRCAGHSRFWEFTNTFCAQEYTQVTYIHLDVFLGMYLHINRVSFPILYKMLVFLKILIILLNTVLC